MQIVWTDPALFDLSEIRSFIERDNHHAAQEVAGRILNSVVRLQFYPNSGRIGDEPETREIITPGLPYILVYRIAVGQIEILRVWHQRENRNIELD